LLDEPFGALDAQVRVTLRRWLRELHEELELTTVFVTHDQEEALELADRIAVMNNGRIEQVGSPEVIYQQPATPFVCEFIGKVNRFSVRKHGDSFAAGGWHSDDDPWQGRFTDAVAYVRPEQLRLAVPASHPAWQARLRHIYLAGSVAHLDLHIASLDLALEADVASEDLSRLGLHSGMELRVAPRSAVMFPLDAQGAPLSAERWIWHARSPVPA
jgi:sulfate transport system ATP-binding protein